MSAILVKMPPQILSTLAPRDSPIAKPMKQDPARAGGTKTRIAIISISSVLIRSTPMLMPERVGISETGRARPRSAANAMRLFAMLLISMPNQATANDPPMPMSDQARMRTTVEGAACFRKPK